MIKQIYSDMQLKMLYLNQNASVLYSVNSDEKNHKI